MKTKYQVQTGGKPYLAGEYGVPNTCYGAVIQFILIYLSATIQEATTLPASLRPFNYRWI